MRSEGQRAAKLPAIKLWEWFNFAWVRTRADCFEWGRGQLADFFSRPPTLKSGNFEALWSTDPKFALSKRPHFHRVYLVTICKWNSIAVCIWYKDYIKHLLVAKKVMDHFWSFFSNLFYLEYFVLLLQKLTCWILFSLKFYHGIQIFIQNWKMTINMELFKIS